MRFLFVLLFVSSYFLSQAQIKGLILDENQQPLPGAAVALLAKEQVIAGTTTNIDGVFELQADQGSYTLQVSYISFLTYTEQITITQSPITVDPIVLKADNTALEEVTIQADANLTEFKQDKRVYNVAKDLNTAGSNASEILLNIPSVDVDIEGNVSLRGSQNVRILIDGKPSGLVGTDPANALRTIQAAMIERIEVITNPSARYEAQGEAGIINIVLRKEKQKGLNGSFETNLGYPDLYGASAGINYRKGKLNFFTNLGFNYRSSPGGGSTEQTFSLNDTSYAFNSTREQIRARSSGTIRLGADYSLTANQTLTGSFLFVPSFGDNEVTLTYDDLDQNGFLTSTQIREDIESENRTTIEGDLHYEKSLTGKDHKWTMDFRFQDTDDRESSNITQYTIDLGDEVFQTVSNQEDEQNILFQTDYTRPLGDKKSFETGARMNLRNIINDYEVAQLQPNGLYEPLDSFTNNFNYEENIAALYAIYNDAFEDITYQIGLRAEYTGIVTEQVKEDIVNPRDYFNLFPSAFLTWKISALGDLQKSYSRRISSPDFRSLLPFFSFSDNRNFYSGNPDLNPEFTDSYEIGYLRYFSGATLYGGFYYRHRTGVTERIRTVDETGFTELFPVNLAVQDAYGIELTYDHKLNDWWRVNANTNIYQAVNVGSYEGIDYGSRNFSAQGRASSRFSFWKSDLQLSFNFRAPRTTGQGRSLGIYSMDVGWSKDVLNKNGTITFNVTDLFNTRKRRSIVSGDNFTSESEFQWRIRQISLSFSYRLNQKKKRSRGKGGSEGEGFGI